MTTLVDKAIITMLAAACLLLVWKLYRKEEKAEQVAAPQDRDLFNMKEYEDRQNQFAREIRLEKRA